MIEKEISLHLNSNKPKAFQNLIESIRETSYDINKIEIIVHIDKNDLKMKNTIDEINSISPTLISYLETDMIKNFSDAWKPLNLLLKKTSEAEDPGLLADKAVKNREDALPDEGTEALALQRHRAVLAKEPVDFAELEPARRKEASEAGPGTRVPRRVRTRAGWRTHRRPLHPAHPPARPGHRRGRAAGRRRGSQRQRSPRPA